MICEPPIAYGPNQGQTARGTATGYRRHRKAGDPACAECREANRVYGNKWYRDKKNLPPKPAPTPVRRPPDRRRAPRCAICGGAYSEHTVGQWCRPTPMEEAVG